MLNNKVVLVSGGLGRIGSALCESLVSNGAKIIAGDYNQKLGEKFLKKLGENNGMFFSGDLTDPKVIKNMIEEAENKYGKIDAAVHCAYPQSKSWGTAFEKLEPKYLREDLFNQLGGALLFSQQVVEFFRKQGFGNLIHISSIQGISAPKFKHYEGTKMNSPIEYSAIKSGVIAITRYLAKYLKKENIRVNCISPGGILSGQPENFLKKYNNDCSSKGMLDAKDLVGVLTFLLSEDSLYINGQNIVIDDGWSL